MTQHDDRSNENQFATIAVGAAETKTRPHGGGTSDVVPPIHLSTTFEWGSGDKANEHDYSRESNPTRVALEEQLARLEGGEHALAFASGMAAISTTMLSLVPPGGTSSPQTLSIAAPKNCSRNSLPDTSTSTWTSLMPVNPKTLRLQSIQKPT